MTIARVRSMSCGLASRACGTGTRWVGWLNRPLPLFTTDDAPHPDARSVSLRRRLVIACTIGLAAGTLAYIHMGVGKFFGDFFYPWFAARLLHQGHNPYLAIPGIGIHPLSTPLAYPLPTVLASIPFSLLSFPLGAGVFFGVSSGLLAFGLTKDGYYRLPIFLSAPFIGAALQAQWSPLVSVPVVIPTLGFLAVFKPNLGLAVAAYKPSRWLVAGCVIVLGVSLVVMPSWPVDWWHNVRRLPGHGSALLAPGGVLLLLSLLRWRLPEGRLLLAMACVPQVIFWYDQLPLLLIPRTFRESLVLTLASNVGVVVWGAQYYSAPPEIYGPAAAPYIMGLIYLPALIMVLRRKRRVPFALASATD